MSQYIYVSCIIDNCFFFWLTIFFSFPKLFFHVKSPKSCILFVYCCLRYAVWFCHCNHTITQQSIFITHSTFTLCIMCTYSDVIIFMTYLILKKKKKKKRQEELKKNVRIKTFTYIYITIIFHQNISYFLIPMYQKKDSYLVNELIV